MSHFGIADNESAPWKKSDEDYLRCGFVDGQNKADVDALVLYCCAGTGEALPAIP